jgi:hypothetical protein
MLLAEAKLQVKAREDLISKLNEAGETLGEATKKIVAFRASRQSSVSACQFSAKCILCTQSTKVYTFGFNP